MVHTHTHSTCAIARWVPSRDGEVTSPNVVVGAGGAPLQRWRGGGARAGRRGRAPRRGPGRRGHSPSTAAGADGLSGLPPLCAPPPGTAVTPPATMDPQSDAEGGSGREPSLELLSCAQLHATHPTSGECWGGGSRPPHPAPKPGGMVPSTGVHGCAWVCKGEIHSPCMLVHGCARGRAALLAQVCMAVQERAALLVRVCKGEIRSPCTGVQVAEPLSLHECA
ncbi:uncharacterized protein LOC128141254 [Harpia harpyja]|uniref:uncharacterized protein LOC128141254 n=1 Tax=Harpia harpyja TaxID=202280 RepID=UPI0022B13EB8|nr:uncharacterized protein LOC128141254 [Harpia harpyja]